MSLQIALALASTAALIGVALYSSRPIVRSRRSAALGLVLAGLVVALVPGVQASAVFSVGTIGPRATTSNPQTFVARSANRQPVGGAPPQAALRSARSEGRN